MTIQEVRMSVRPLRRIVLSLVTVLSLACLDVLGHAQGGPAAAGPTDPQQRLRWFDQHVAMKRSSPFKDTAWQFLGPTNISGRVTDVAVATPRGKYYTAYVATASGGVWKTINDGTTWEPVYDQGPSTSTGEVTLAPSDPDIVWIGTGEGNIFRSSMAGTGVYKSLDGGKAWQHMGLAGTHTIPRIVIHPANPDIVYVAASGHEWTDNDERGVFRTADGGKTWQKVLFVNARTGAIDLVMDPSDSNVLYAATWQRIRRKWNDPRNDPDYASSGIHKTVDGGKTWTPINEGLPPPQFRGRIGIDVARSNPNVLYAFVDNYEIGRPAKPGEVDAYGRPMRGTIKGAEVYRSNDKGKTWAKVSQSNASMERASGTYGWVFGQVRVDPNDENVVYVMGLGLNVSTDGGKTFSGLPGMHGDHHALWIDPSNSNFLVNGNDGGVVFSYDRGRTWRQFTDNLPVVQFFNVSFDTMQPFHVYGSIQDHGSRRGVVDLSRGRDRIAAVAFTSAPGGEGSTHAIDPRNPNIVYSSTFYGNLTRADVSTADQRGARIRGTPIAPKAAAGDPPLRGQWLAPTILSPHDPDVVYHGMQYLFRSPNRGDTWERISPDLTYNDPKQIGDIPYQTIFSIAESPMRAGLVYAGTDDGRAHVTMDGGKTWAEVTTGLAPRRWVSRIVASAFNEATVYLSQNGKRDDDFAPYLWKSTDRGATWTSIVANIPCGPINVIREDPTSPRILYVGTDLGVYVTIDGGASWEVLGTNLPSTFVHDLVIHPRDRIIVIATHGRGMWAMDAIPIQSRRPAGD
jgi:photosystem II stability/assembly factor-like uncharacterized protein